MFISLLLLSQVSIFGQDQIDKGELVGFGCYYSGSSTKVVIKVERLIASKNYKSIIKLLHVKNPGEKYLAVISLQKLEALSLIILNREEKDLIERIKNSNELVSVCSGCTYFSKIQMKKLIEEGDMLGSKLWLERNIKK